MRKSIAACTENAGGLFQHVLWMFIYVLCSMSSTWMWF
jgi:hypothetical protein